MMQCWRKWLVAAGIALMFALGGCANMPTNAGTGAVIESTDSQTSGGYYDNGIQVGTISDDTVYGTGENDPYWQGDVIDGGTITDDTATVADGGPLYPDETGPIDGTQDAVSIAAQAEVDGMNPVIYFAFDSYYLNAQDKRKIRYFARKVLRDNRVRIRLEGHTDERGSLEYNLALGEKRAKAVAREFHRNGISYRRMDVISYGELRPAVPGHNERAWRLNRRVEMIFYRK